MTYMYFLNFSIVYMICIIRNGILFAFAHVWNVTWSQRKQKKIAAHISHAIRFVEYSVIDSLVKILSCSIFTPARYMGRSFRAAYVDDFSERWLHATTELT